MAWTSLQTRLDNGTIPVILCGPLLRHTGTDSVTVWIALKESRTVTLHVYRSTGDSRSEVLIGQRQTSKLGQNLFVVAVTAGPVGSDRLQEQETYYYDLDLGSGQKLASPGVVSLDTDEAKRRSIYAYDGYDLPSFALPPKDLNKMRLIHGSCRKAHGEGWDAFPILDTLIASALSNPGTDSPAVARPHLLLLTGDQIYADDVADALLAVLTEAGNTLLGWTEQLPGFNSARTTADDAFKPGKRSWAITFVAGFTSGIPDPEKCKSHLVSLGEFYAMYLFGWSDVLWPPALPNDLGSKEEREQLLKFRKGLPAVRRALANIPVYMIFDDHEITDDWNMNREWCGRVYGRSATAMRPAHPASELGRRIIQNGLAAYAVFQAWGNTPALFWPSGATGNPGRDLLAALGNWHGVLASPALDEIAKRVGLPTGQLPLVAGGAVSSLPRPAGALTWSYFVSLPDYKYELLMLDCRTAREYPAGNLSPSGLMSADAFRTQMVDPQPTSPGKVEVSFVVAQAPVFGLPWLEQKQREARDEETVWDRDVEAWGLRATTFQTMLSHLGARRERVIILSGDVHYGFAVRVGYWARHPFGQPALTARRNVAMTQLVSSALRNETHSWHPAATTDTFQLYGYSPYPILGLKLNSNPEDWAGWNHAPPSADIKLPSNKSQFPEWQPDFFRAQPALLNVTRRPNSQRVCVPEDWLYRIEFVTGNKQGGTTNINPVSPPGPADAKEALKFQKKVAQARNELLRGTAGSEIVGVNNIGELEFIWPDGIDTKFVIQKLWWGSADGAAPLVHTDHQILLDPTDATFEPRPVQTPCP